MNHRVTSLTSLIFIALFAGAITGILIQNFMTAESLQYFRNTVLVDGVFYVVGTGFIRLMQMLVVPLVFCSIVCGAMSIGDTKTLGTIGLKTLFFYLFTTAMALIIALTVAIVINPGLGINFEIAQTATTDNVKFADTILNIIPKNPIESLAKGDMLPIIFFALIIGIVLARVRSTSDILAAVFTQGNSVMMDMTMLVMKLAPG